MRRPRPSLAAVLAALAVVAGSTRAAAITCDTLPGPLYISGSTAIGTLVGEIGKVLAQEPTPDTTVVYLGAGSCTGVDAILNGTPLTGSAGYWDATGTEQMCDLPAGQVADIGVSDVFPSTCTPLPGGLPSDIGEFLGPVQAMTFVAPHASTQESISAQAAYCIFGLGAGSGVAPWTDTTTIFQRDQNSGTQRMIAKAIGVDPATWMGTPTTSSSDMLAKVVAATPADGALGILVADVGETNRATLVTLAYQHFDQDCGYYPDKTVSGHEKQNVRDGHYAIWGPLHLLSKLNGQGYPVKASARDVIGYLTGTKPPPGGLDLIALEAQGHVVPQCAMRVSRTDEIGALASYAPPGACGCYYDAVTDGSSDCATCSNPSDCPSDAPVCNYGYCETQ
jgi:ABC-type phosphate transport system substrate-binding protein